MNSQTIELLHAALVRLEAGFARLPPFQQDYDRTAMANVLSQVADRLGQEIPFFHPLYAGQMLKPPHPVAHLAYTLAMYLNPNNHALDGGRVSSVLEREAVEEIARMFGWQAHLGHLTGGGTLANLEALWVAGKLNPDGIILASNQAHYTHDRISGVLGLKFAAVAVDSHARMAMDELEQVLQQGGVGTVVATLGTTGTGSTDPLPEILELKARYGFRLHVDAAYGGYFTLAGNLDAETQAAFDVLHHADSIVVDPHKHGLQPYGCGCVLFKDPAVGRLYKHDSPCTYFSSDALHLGEISLECSRAGAAAAALWATQQLLPMERGGEFAAGLEKGRNAALKLYQYLAGDPRFLTLFPPELDIIVFAPKADTASSISALSRKYFRAAEQSHLYLALMELPSTLLQSHWREIDFDRESVTCLRSCLIKPEHLDWIDRIWNIISTLETGP